MPAIRIILLSSSTKRIYCTGSSAYNKSPHLLTTGRRSSRSIPTMTHCFALHRQSPCLSLWRKAKPLQLNNSCPLPSKNTIQETLGKRILPRKHILAKTHQEFPIKVPFYLPLKCFFFFSRTSIPQNKTHHHIHTKQQLNNLK